jgi:hypothetical protein
MPPNRPAGVGVQDDFVFAVPAFGDELSAIARPGRSDFPAPHRSHPTRRKIVTPGVGVRSRDEIAGRAKALPAISDRGGRGAPPGRARAHQRRYRPSMSTSFRTPDVSLRDEVGAAATETLEADGVEPRGLLRSGSAVELHIGSSGNLRSCALSRPRRGRYCSSRPVRS